MVLEENDHGDGEGNQNTVFVHTSLNTHLATIVSDSDTISDLKRKMMLEHLQCFPAIGDIKIHCLKVKRRGNYYHLTDSMLVKSAFGASQKKWFLSADASHLEQCDGFQHKAGNMKMKDSLSIDTLANRPSKLSLIHVSPSKHSKIMPFVNQKVPSDDSCKNVSKHIEEDRSSNLEPDLEVEEKLHCVNKEIKLKKRVGDEDASLKKRRKTKRTKGDVKALVEHHRVLINDADKVKDMGTSINDEKSIKDNSKSKDAALDGVVVVTKAMNDEHTRTLLVSQRKKIKRTKKGRISADDQVATVVPLSVENAGDLKNSEASEVMPDVAMVMEKNIQQEADIGNEIPPSSMEGATAEDELKVSEADNLVVDSSSTVPTSVFDEQKNDHKTSDEKNVVLEKTLIDDSIVYNNMKKVKIAEPTESHRIRKSRKGIKETAGKRVKKKDFGKSSKEDEVMKKHSNDAATGTNLLPPSEKKESLSIDALHVDNDAEISKTNAEISEKQNEKKNMDVDLHEKIADVSCSQSDGDKLISKDAETSDEGLVKKPKRNHKSTTRAHSHMPSKLELEPEKSKIPQEASKNMTASQVPKGNDVNSDAAALDNDESGKEKDTKLSEENDSATESLSRNENNKDVVVSKKVPVVSTDVVTVKDPNKMKTQTPKTTRKVTKQQPTMEQNHVKNLKKSAPVVKSLLNTPATIFGNDSDDNGNDNDNATVNSDSSTQIPPPSSSSSSSSSGESDYSMDSRRYVLKRKEGAGKNIISSQSKNILTADWLRSSSRFKKARVTASKDVNDTESQSVDFVPESQPVDFLPESQPVDFVPESQPVDFVT